MLTNTRAVIDKIAREIKYTARCIKYSAQAFTIIYLIYALIANVGIVYINIPLLLLNTAYFIFDIACIYKAPEDKKEKKAFKKRQKNINKTYKRIKLALQSVTLVSTLYGIAIAANSASAVTVLFATITAVTWLVGVMTQLLSAYIESRKEMFFSAVKADVSEITAPFIAAKNAVTNTAETVVSFVSKNILGKAVIFKRMPSLAAKPVDKVTSKVKNIASQWKKRHDQNKKQKQLAGFSKLTRVLPKSAKDEKRDPVIK